MNNKFKTCAEKMKEISSLAQIYGLINWDQDTMMPPRASVIRADQSSTIAGIIHEKIIDPKLGELLRELKNSDNELSEDERVCVREWLRDYEQSVKMPPELVRELAHTTSAAQEIWVKARRKSDFAFFAPILGKIFDLKKKEADALGFKGVRYDALLDIYEPKASVAALDPLFGSLKKELVPIVGAICDSRVKINSKLFSRSYPKEDQELLARELMKAMGVEEGSSRLDVSAHPFCCGLAPTDVRITTRYDEKYFPQAIYGVIHESGHALYEQGLPEKNIGTPLAEAVSLGIHESQSRIWENIIGRGKPFLRFLLPRLKKKFAGQFKGIKVDDFYRTINRVFPSMIRVEADEVTYNLHVILRYEIEKSVMAGDVQVKDLPSVWNEKMKEYLGIKPKNDAEGVLQDVHWSNGQIGYFPTYVLGNLYAAQLWSKIKKDIKSADDKISRGELKPILSWLRRNVHCHGRKYPPGELVKLATGEAPSSRYFVDYLKAKFGEIYGIGW